jgi:galactitol-specific phosphotransferase system IIB component
MLRYNEYLIEIEFKKWESLSELTNEGFDSLIDRIESFLDKEYTLDTSKFEEVVLNLFKRFKGKLKILTLIASVLISSYMASSKVENLMDKAGIEISTKREVIDDVTTKKDEIKVKNDLHKFLKDLAQKESSMNPKAVNRLGYIGKYQFGNMALQDLELDDKINAHKFKKNPAIFPEKMQDKAMIKLLKLNKNYLGNYIEKFVGKNVAGVNITKSGLLAGSHLVGAGAIKKFLDSNGVYIPKDANGVPVTEYIQKFGGYNLFL